MCQGKNHKHTRRNPCKPDEVDRAIQRALSGKIVLLTDIPHIKPRVLGLIAISGMSLEDAAEQATQSVNQR